MKAREIVLAARPRGWPQPSDFAMRGVELAEPKAGELVVRTLYLSLDPYMRGMMNEGKSYAQPFAVGAPLTGRVIGVVEASRNPAYTEGDMVFAMLRWADRAIATGAEDMRKIDPALAPPAAWLGPLGMTGMTAWVGMTLLGEPKPGGEVFVSAASGAVGQIAGQLAKLAGARVVGSAGSAEKCAFVKGLGFDDCFDHRAMAPADALPKLFPDGLDLYFDNVGGPTLDAAIAAMNPFGRIVVCGMVSQYNEAEPYGVKNLPMMTRMRISMQGFIVRDWFDRIAEFLAFMAPLVRDGRIRHREHVVTGLENAPAAFIGMLRGENLGKTIVQVAAA
jgi:NADPH-dependent curcumin reductase CurA